MMYLHCILSYASSLDHRYIRYTILYTYYDYKYYFINVVRTNKLSNMKYFKLAYCDTAYNVIIIMLNIFFNIICINRSCKVFD